MIAVYNCDENYISTFATSMLSLFENNKEAETLDVYLIGNGISEKNQRRVKEIAETYRRNVFFVQMPKVDGYELQINYGRLFIAEILPEDADKAIYIDCDSIVTGSLNELWDMDISAYYAAMVIDLLGPNDRKLLGIAPDGIYYSDAIMLVNVKRWRDEKIIDAFVDYIHQMQGIVPYLEMGCLNAVLDGKIKLIPAKFNVQTPYYSFTGSEIKKLRRLKSFYSDEEIEEAKKNPVMIHFTLDILVPLRPWMVCCNHPCTDLYLSYREKTPWKEDALIKKDISLLKKLYSAYFRHVPRKLAVWTTMVLYTYVKPLVFRVQKHRQLHAKNKVTQTR